MRSSYTGCCTSIRLAATAILVAALLCSCDYRDGQTALNAPDRKNGGYASSAAQTERPSVPWETMPRQWQQVRGSCRFCVAPVAGMPGMWSVRFWTIEAPQDVTTVRVDEARIPAILANIAWRHPANLDGPADRRTPWEPWPDYDVFKPKNDEDLAWQKWDGVTGLHWLAGVRYPERPAELWVLERVERGKVWAEIDKGTLVAVRTYPDEWFGPANTVQAPYVSYAESVVPVR